VQDLALVAGLCARMATVRDLRARRSELRVALGEARDELARLAQLAATRLDQRGAEIGRLEAARARHEESAGEQAAQAEEQRAVALHLRRYAAERRLAALEAEHDQLQEEWRTAQALGRIWRAAVPLRRALHFEAQAKQQRALLEQQARVHAPQRTQLETAARRLTAALSARAAEARLQAELAREQEEAERDEASDCRRQVARAHKAQIKAETLGHVLVGRLTVSEARREQLWSDGLLGTPEVPEAALARWTAKIRGHEEAVARIDRELAAVDAALDGIAAALAEAAGVLGDRQAHHREPGRRDRAAQGRRAIGEAARAELARLLEERGRRGAERRQLEARRRTEETELADSRDAQHRLQVFVEDHVRPGTVWRGELDETRRGSERAIEDARRWEAQARDAEQRAADAADLARRHDEEARALDAEKAGLAYLGGGAPAEPGPLDELRARYRLLRSRYEEKLGADAILAVARHNDELAREERARLTKLLSPEITEELVREHVARLAEPDRIEQLRQDAEVRTSSLLGRLGYVEARLEAARRALQEAEDACTVFEVLPPLEDAPETAEEADEVALELEGMARLDDNSAESERESAVATRQRLEELHQRRAELAQALAQVRSLEADHADLLATVPPPRSRPRRAPAVDEAELPALVAQLGDALRKSRAEWQELDRRRGRVSAELRTLAVAAAGRLDDLGLRRVIEHDDPALEEASAQLLAQLEERAAALKAQPGADDPADRDP
jgi:hypothetical protein